MAGLKVFFDSFSQPSRAVLLLLQANKIPYQPCMIKIAQGEVEKLVMLSSLMSLRSLSLSLVLCRRN